MLSRRNIRVKVMQVLYAMSRDEKLTYKGALQRYQQGIRKSFDLYIFNLLAFVKVTEYAQEAAEKKLTKLRPTEEDRSFTPKLFDNPLTQSIFQNPGFQSEVKKCNVAEKLNDDSIRSLYIEFAKTDNYKNYLKGALDGGNEHHQILLSLYKFCQNSELFTEMMEDNYLSWVDDKSLVIGALKKTLKALPATDSFYEEYRPTEETTVDFGEALLKEVNESDKKLLELIEPTLKNWDADRVAVIDMILLKMALCELMSFPTIPTKVTLNEFVEISKQYSTDKSKDFINGILDRLMKRLEKDGKITKEGRGLIE